MTRRDFLRSLGAGAAALAGTRVAFAEPRPGFTAASATVPLDQIRAGYVAGSLALGALALVLVGGALSGLLAPLLAALLVGGLAIVPLLLFRHRVNRIETRLMAFLDEVPATNPEAVSPGVTLSARIGPASTRHIDKLLY